ncbi:FMN-binding negative transcriptional regulator [bacterium]|nr:FMN-binding negative transcriptional regulator [bacterium]
MWSPDYYRLSDRQRIIALIREYPFGVLSMSDRDGRMQGVHLPFLVDELPDGSIEFVAHLARANPLHDSFDGEREALVVFSGPHGYVSPSDYASEGQVPTWNYIAVHAAGKPVKYADGADSALAIERLVEAMEPGDSGWRMAMLDERKRDGLLRGIVAFRMLVDRLDGKLKLNQNKNAEDIRNVAARQAALGNTDLADWMISELERGVD